jgi:hypothetical protein
VKGANYSWEYTEADDRFALRDTSNRLIVGGKMQPAIVVASVDSPTEHFSSAGKVASVRAEDGKVTINYDGVNGAALVTIAWRFDAHGIWTDPVVYEAAATHDIVSLQYFRDAGGKRAPALHSTYVVSPGILEGGTVSPIVHDAVHLDSSVWLGRGSEAQGFSQQWGLPVHYFCGFSTAWPGGEKNLYTSGRSEAFTCGLADLPGGDYFLQFHNGQASPWIDYRSDLWKHLRGPGKLKLGATLVWVVAPDYYEAIAAYYDALLQAGIIHRKQNSARKTAISLLPEYCTWGAQRTRGKTGDKLDEAFLNDVYRDLKATGMKAQLFSIDDKWEGAYGNLEHSATRLPHFEEFLARLRADGVKIGLWAALMRCERPADLGLTLDNMLKKPDGTAFAVNPNGPNTYYILDFTQPVVAEVLSALVKKFIRRYKPDVFKFDFGYELPAAGVASPQDKNWTGERLMWKGLEVVIKAMHEENPDQVVMYYNLSPLFLEYFDLHSSDDLFLDWGNYQVEANRRFFFSSLMGRLGVPTYGSSGYDWSSSPSIWFDSAALGTVGSLNDFAGDEEGELPTPEIVAKYNGISKTLRSSNFFEILPLGNVSQASVLGAHASSWARMENGQLVLLAYRPPVVGEENLLASWKASREVKDAVRANVPVVVASKDKESIARARDLAVVPYASGEIVIRRQQGRSAEIVNHYFGGSSSSDSATIANGELKLVSQEHSADGKPLEWIEVRIS